MKELANREPGEATQVGSEELDAGAVEEIEEVEEVEERVSSGKGSDTVEAQGEAGAEQDAADAAATKIQARARGARDRRKVEELKADAQGAAQSDDAEAAGRGEATPETGTHDRAKGGEGEEEEEEVPAVQREQSIEERAHVEELAPDVRALIGKVRLGKKDDFKALVAQDESLLARAVDGGGNTLLHIAAGNGQKGVVKLLLRHGDKIDLRALNKKGKTALDLAIEFKYDKLAEYLREKLHTPEPPESLPASSIATDFDDSAAAASVSLDAASSRADAPASAAAGSAPEEAPAERDADRSGDGSVSAQEGGGGGAEVVGEQPATSHGESPKPGGSAITAAEAAGEHTTEGHVPASAALNPTSAGGPFVSEGIAEDAAPDSAIVEAGAAAAGATTELGRETSELNESVDELSVSVGAKEGVATATPMSAGVSEEVQDIPLTPPRGAGAAASAAGSVAAETKESEGGIVEEVVSESPEPPAVNLTMDK